MNTLTLKGCVEMRKGLEGCGAATAQPGPERVSAEPRKARFFAEQKMRPYSLLIIHCSLFIVHSFRWLIV
jgi:hypothetical protein